VREGGRAASTGRNGQKTMGNRNAQTKPVWSRWGVILALALGLGACVTQITQKHGLVETVDGRPIMPKMIPRSVIGEMPSGTFSSQRVEGIVVMDTGADYDVETSLTYLTYLLERYQSRLKFGDVPFHYFIDRDGKILAGRDVRIPAELYTGDPFTLRSSGITPHELAMARLARKTQAPLDLTGYITVVFLGDYDLLVPTKEQEKALMQLLAFLVFDHYLPLERIRGLSSLYPETKNPGFYLANYLQPRILEQNIPKPPKPHYFTHPAYRSTIK